MHGKVKTKNSNLSKSKYILNWQLVEYYIFLIVLVYICHIKVISIAFN